MKRQPAVDCSDGDRPAVSLPARRSRCPSSHGALRPPLEAAIRSRLFDEWLVQRRYLSAESMALVLTPEPAANLDAAAEAQELARPPRVKSDAVV